MKKIKTIEAVAAYKTLKALKTSSMSDDAAMRVWKNMKEHQFLSRPQRI